MKVIIHGGFFSEWHTDTETKKAKQNAMERIVKQAYAYLENHTAQETVVYAVSLLEDDPLFNAGTGSQIQSDGKIRMSAAVMDSSTMKMSGVINIEEVKNPIKVAELLLPYDDRILGGEGATAFARNNGFEPFFVATPQRIKEYEEKLKSTGLGTVGCVALDNKGNLAVATSTGGKGFEMVGRISDSATVAGNYANAYCAVSCTGVGEDIVSNATATKIVTRVTDGMALKDAFSKTFDEMKPYDGFCGAIAIDHKGNIYHDDSHPSMVYAGYDGKELDIFV
jgi:L-asparaginase